MFFSTDSVCLKMNDENHNQTIISAPEENSLKRKRGRPPNIRQLNESSEEEAQNVVKHNNLLGHSVSGVLNGTFDAGYFVTVKPQNSNLTLTGLVFCPEKVLSVTPENDLAPKVKMYQRVISSQNALEIQVPNTLASKCECREVASMVECDQETEEAFTIKGNELSEQGYNEFQMRSYYTPVVENLQDYRIVDHDEIMNEFEASACMNAPASVSPPLKPCDYNLESIAEMDSVYPENLINNESSQNTKLKLMDATQTATASFDVNERPTTDDNVRSDLQLGIIAEAKYSTSTKMCHFSTEGLTVDKTDDKQSEQRFFFNLNDVNKKKSVTGSLSFTVGESGEPNCDSTSDEPVQEGELKLIASGLNPRENLNDKIMDV